MAQGSIFEGNKEGLLELENRLMKTKGSYGKCIPTAGEGYDAYGLLVDESEEDKLHSLNLPYTGKDIKDNVHFDDKK